MEIGPFEDICPIKNRDIPASYVSLPEGSYQPQLVSLSRCDRWFFVPNLQVTPTESLLHSFLRQRFMFQFTLFKNVGFLLGLKVEHK